MKRSSFKNIIPVVYAFILIAGCAKISSPSGGPRDKEPPVILKSVPLSGSKTSKGRRL